MQHEELSAGLDSQRNLLPNSWASPLFAPVAEKSEARVHGGEADTSDGDELAPILSSRPELGRIDPFVQLNVPRVDRINNCSSLGTPALGHCSSISVIHNNISLAARSCSHSKLALPYHLQQQRRSSMVLSNTLRQDNASPKMMTKQGRLWYVLLHRLPSSQWTAVIATDREAVTQF
jgi:hypothetical protein